MVITHKNARPLSWEIQGNYFVKKTKPFSLVFPFPNTCIKHPFSFQNTNWCNDQKVISVWWSLMPNTTRHCSFSNCFLLNMLLSNILKIKNLLLSMKTRVQRKQRHFARRNATGELEWNRFCYDYEHHFYIVNIPVTFQGPKLPIYIFTILVSEHVLNQSWIFVL